MNTVNCIQELCRLCNNHAREKGFWNNSSNIPEKLALVHSEVCEALEAVRHDYPLSDHLEKFTLFEEELADICIRVFDLAGQLKVNLAGAIHAKMEYNKNRPFMHGKKC